MKTFEEQQQMLDEFFEQMVSQAKAFIEQNELIPLGRRYELSLIARRRRTGIHFTTKKKMSLMARWKMTNELPSDQDWEVILSLPDWSSTIYVPGSGPRMIREALVDVKENNSGSGAYIYSGPSYAPKINRKLEEINNEFRLFHRGNHHYVLRRMQ